MAADVCDPIMDAKYRWLVDEGVTLCDGAPLAAPAAVKQWFAQRRAFLQNQLATVAASFAVNGPASFISTMSPVTLTGTAPIEVNTIWVNGVALDPTWTSVTAFSLVVPLWQPRLNSLSLVGHDVNGNPVPGALAQVTVDYVGPPPPEWNRLARINEWMAANDGSVRDPADSQASDWFELYNPGAAPADISGFFLTDNLADWTKWQVPAATVIPAGGYLLVWADGEPEQNGLGPDLHSSFQLSRDGESIGLFAPDGAPVDSVTFDLQVDDLSQGRYADGSPAFYFLTRPTPRGPNALPYLPTDDAPRLEPNSVQIVGDEIRFGWLSVVGRTYQLFYADDLTTPDWQALGPARTATVPVMQAVDNWGEFRHRFYRLVQSGP
jgi:hypothetical protein